MAGWQNRLNRHESELTPGDDDREAWHAVVHGPQKKSDMTEQLTNISDSYSYSCFPTGFYMHVSIFTYSYAIDINPTLICVYVIIFVCVCVYICLFFKKVPFKGKILH